MKKYLKLKYLWRFIWILVIWYILDNTILIKEIEESDLWKNKWDYEQIMNHMKENNIRSMLYDNYWIFIIYIYTWSTQIIKCTWFDKNCYVKEHYVWYYFRKIDLDWVQDIGTWVLFLYRKPFFHKRTWFFYARNWNINEVKIWGWIISKKIDNYWWIYEETMSR